MRRPGLRFVFVSACAAVVAACGGPSAPPGPSVPAPGGGSATGDAGGGTATPAADADLPADVDAASPLGRFRDAVRYRDGATWMRVEVAESLVTGTRRRIYFEKAAATRALLGHAGGRGTEAAPLPWADGTTFVAENLSADGDLRETAVLRVRAGGKPEFLLFDAAGAPLDTFAQADDPPSGPVRGNAPAVCEKCHLGAGSFDPMSSFPDEPRARRLVVDPRFRNRDIVLRFLESVHRGGRVFGVYGSLWMSRLAADAKSGTLTPTDTGPWLSLREKYPDLLK